MPTSEYRYALIDRLDAEGFTFSLVQGLGRIATNRATPWKPVIRQRLEDERKERAFQRTAR